MWPNVKTPISSFLSASLFLVGVSNAMNEYPAVRSPRVDLNLTNVGMS